MKNKKVKQKYVDEVMNEDWKRTDDETGVSVSWCDKEQKFLCVDDLGFGYKMEYENFFRNHVIKSNKRVWETLSDSDNRQKTLASWLCLVNGYNIFEDHKDRFEVSGRSKSNNGGCGLTKYVFERFEDAQHSILEDIPPTWLTDTTRERFELK